MKDYTLPDDYTMMYDQDTDEGYVWSHKTNQRLSQCLGGKYLESLVYNEAGKQQHFKIHRLIAEYFIPNPENLPQVDHINQNKTDNRIENLRWSSRSHNQHNKNVKGYYWHKKIKKWCSQIVVNRKNIFLGYFDTEEEARQAYLEASKKYYPDVKFDDTI